MLDLLSLAACGDRDARPDDFKAGRLDQLANGRIAGRGPNYVIAKKA
jgi:hypothetical protein